MVKLRGPVADPKLELSSQPTLPQDEILSRLLFGRSVARLTPVQGLRLAAAVDTLRGGGGLSDMLSALRKGLGVDTLDVAGGATAQESTAKAGKYVSDNVFVEVERGVAEGSGKARVQVELTPNLLPGTDPDCVKVVEKNITKRGGTILKNARAERWEKSGDGVAVTVAAAFLVARKEGLLGSPVVA